MGEEERSCHSLDFTESSAAEPTAEPQAPAHRTYTAEGMVTVVSSSTSFSCLSRSASISLSSCSSLVS